MAVTEERDVALAAPQRRVVTVPAWVDCVLHYVVLTVVLGIVLVPIAWMLVTSLKADNEALSTHLLPTAVHLENYVKAVRVIPFFRYTLNTLEIALLTTIGTVVSSALPAYGFAKLSWKWREVVFFVVLSTMMLPYIVTMIPLYIIFRGLGWIDTYFPLWVPAFFGDAFSIFLFRQFFRTIPNELLDAARIDGLSEWGIFWKIVLPLARSAVIAIAVLAFTASWTAFVGPLIYLHDPDKFTLALGLRSFLNLRTVEWPALMAASILYTVPVIVLFVLVQRLFIEGITFTGTKG